MVPDNTLHGKIVRAIRNSQDHAIPFRDYMAMCLYDPEDGYYMKDKERIGPGGDFYTSASIGGIMGMVLARYISEVARGWGEGPVVLAEWGGGSGALAKQILDELRSTNPELYAGLSYISIEQSPAHRMLQKQTLHTHEALVCWMTEQDWLHKGPWNRTWVLSNELIDAFPVDRVRIHHGQPHEVRVGINGAGDEFVEKLVQLDEGAVLAYVQGISQELEEGQQLEVNLSGMDWLHIIGKAIQSGEVITIDYGDQEEELYAAHRMKGTLMCYTRHAAHDDPYVNPGDQDITTHVNFSRLMQAGEQSGMQTKFYGTQKQFLVDHGVLQLLQDTTGTDPFSPAAKRNRAIRQLLLSDQMSELFKVLIHEKR
ncbi:class I SAM-dependent methyltransferase [Paenibacillus rigui]|uniref:SAM-dependent methyltransferase n=1 Tax=Paenibacillus rigui TaxID=554312 RepID=A0A229URL2_9BACL|nr:SAM-dependent methyltransferase [Paenibacillus rigui]OXM86072.1 SAM-dependent methyltransferase [Paenibacillus rigui]